VTSAKDRKSEHGQTYNYYENDYGRRQNIRFYL